MSLSKTQLEWADPSCYDVIWTQSGGKTFHERALLIWLCNANGMRGGIKTPHCRFQIPRKPLNSLFPSLPPGSRATTFSSNQIKLKVGQVMHHLLWAKSKFNSIPLPSSSQTWSTRFCLYNRLYMYIHVAEPMAQKATSDCTSTIYWWLFHHLHFGKKELSLIKPSRKTQTESNYLVLCKTPRNKRDENRVPPFSWARLYFERYWNVLWMNNWCNWLESSASPHGDFPPLSNSVGLRQEFCFK